MFPKADRDIIIISSLQIDISTLFWVVQINASLAKKEAVAFTQNTTQNCIKKGMRSVTTQRGQH